jgi:hypothetical protein
MGAVLRVRLARKQFFKSHFSFFHGEQRGGNR